MKIYDRFNQYTWLVETIYHAGYISFKEINRLWVKTEMSGGLPLVRSTFNRHKDAIEEFFGLIIDCDNKNGYKYFIRNSNVLLENSVQNWMLSTITVSNVIRESVSLQNRILLENVPSTNGYLQTILNAMKSERKLSIQYRKYSASETKSYLLEPYCLKLYRQRWYLLGHMSDNSFRIFSLDRMESVEVKNENFKIEMLFDAEDFFHDCFGVFRDNNLKTQRVVLRVYGNERFYLRDLPLHHTQKEISQQDSYSDFEYHLRPSDDFIGQIMLQGNRMEVLEPQWIRDKIRANLLVTLQFYEKKQNPVP